MFRQILLAVGVIVFVMVNARAQTITIDGVTDRSTYTDVATFRVQTNAGFSYLVTLNGVPVPAGISNTVARMDYYDLAVARTNTSNLAVANALVRFIILSSQRGSPELGLIQWVPLPPIPSTGAEMAGAQLNLMTPQDYPAGLDIPVIARVEDSAGNAQRVNGWVSAPGHEVNAFRILRGVGFGFLSPAAPGTNVVFEGALQSLTSTQQINIDSNTTWTTVSGIIGTTTWPTNSRIHIISNLTIPAAATLTIEAGTVVRVNPGVNITNTGQTIINGTATQPVVFTPTNRVAPEKHSGAWGGWFLRGSSAQLIANNAIMTGSGAAQSISYSPSTSHRSEQPLFLVHNNAHMRLTNCAFINLAGQVGNGYFSTITWDRCLVQRAVTVGEWEGCTNIVSRSAMIEFPSVDGIYDADIADSDYDGIYTIRGTNFFVNSLFGFCKDDAMDFGSGGAGSAVVRNCWVESALHEALAWSGEGRRTWTYDSVLLNSGQGIECGWSTTNAASPISPICNASNILTTANSVGARYGDNYTGTSGLGNKHGFLTITNSFVLNNYRDVWGQVWDNTWNYRSNQMDIRSNFLTAPNGYHPSNFIWNPAVDGPRLAAFMSTPPTAPVGIGLALWRLDVTAADLTNGIPVRLSSFTTLPVSVDYVIETPDSVLANGSVSFAPGETVQRITNNPAVVAGAPTWRIVLQNPVGGEVTGADAAYAVPPIPGGPSGPTIVSYNSTWKYMDDGVDQGTAWRAITFADNTWSNGVAQLGFGDSPADEVTRIRRTNNLGTNITVYFRKTFAVTNVELAKLESLALQILRDDAAVVYINGTEVYRNSNLPAPPAGITYSTFANSTGENSIDNATVPQLLTNGLNIVAVEVHQESLGSSDISFDLRLIGNPTPRLSVSRYEDKVIVNWMPIDYVLEQADNVTGPWEQVPGVDIPRIIDIAAARNFYRLRK